MGKMKNAGCVDKKVVKPEKLSVCRVCGGTGSVSVFGLQRVGPNCEGSGRVAVSCEMTLHIRPYKEK